MWKLVTEEPYAGKPHVRFGGRGGAEPSLPLSRSARRVKSAVGGLKAGKIFGAHLSFDLTPKSTRIFQNHQKALVGQ